MTTHTCLFIKPRATTAAGRERRDEFSTLVKSVIEKANLTPLGEGATGLEVRDISMDLVELVYRANVVVVDATCYEDTSSGFSLSPYLFYYLALSHSIGNKTVLVTEGAGHLPPSLRQHHTVVCAGQGFNALREFESSFLRAVQEIVAEDMKPDNPIQGYWNALNAQELAREYARAQAELAGLRSKGDESQAAEAVLKSKERMREEAGKIVFRRIDEQGAGQ